MNPARLLVCLALLLAFAVSAVRAQPVFGTEAPKVEAQAYLNTDIILPGGQNVIAIVVDVPEGLHAQSARPSNENFIPFEVRFSGEPPAGLTVHPAVYPPGEDKTYPLLGTLNVYEGRVVAYLPLTAQSGLVAGQPLQLKLTLTTQLCNDSTCFPPEETELLISTVVASPGTTPRASNASLFAGFDWSTFGQTAPPATRPAAAPEAQSVLGLQLYRDSYPLAFAVALLVGVIFNVMPCVLPVLPLKAYGFYEASQHSRGRSMFLGGVFSVGVVAAFGVLGVIVFFFGQQWGSLFQQAWFTWSMVAILVVMSLGLWNVFTFRLPLGVYSIEPSHNSVGGNLAFGGLTALLSTPCTAPLFPALLLWASAQPRLVGLALMLAVGVGMALPYLILAAFPELARRFPRTGPWSELIKQMMGFLVLGTAVFLAAQSLLPGMQFMYAIAATAVVASLFLIVQTVRLMPRAVPIGVSAALALLLSSASVYSAVVTNQKSVDWQPYSDTALAEARAANKVVLVKFTANWCANCHYVEGTVFGDKKVQSALRSRGVVLLKVDITRSGAPGSELLKSLNPAGGIPLTAIYFPGEDAPTQLASIYTSSTLLETLDKRP